MDRGRKIWYDRTQDDNVHYQQSMLLSAALEEKDILFRQQSYPDQVSISKQNFFCFVSDVCCALGIKQTHYNSEELYFINT